MTEERKNKMTEVLVNKKAYNARKRELINSGYSKNREWDNWESFYNYKSGDEAKLVKGWMRSWQELRK